MIKGTFANFGMYTAGIPIGLLVDKHGPRPGVTLGAVLLGFGYFSIYRCRVSSRDSEAAADHQQPSTPAQRTYPCHGSASPLI